MSRRALTTVFRTLGLFIVAYGLYLAYAIWATALHLRQVGNCADLQTLVTVVETHKSRTGRYPDELSQAVAGSTLSERNRRHYLAAADRWGNDWSYIRTASGFRLVSYGRNGKPDGINHSAPSQRSGCDDLAADVFATERGIVRCCGK